MPPKRTTWSVEQLLNLYQLRVEDKKTFTQIAKVFKTTRSSVQNKFRRVPWDEFLKDPEGYVEDDTMVRKQKWSDSQMAQLDAYLQSDKSYAFIAEKLNRSITSVERQAQITDWKAWKAIGSKDGDDLEPDSDDKKNTILEKYIVGLLWVCHKDFKRLEKTTEKEFLKRVNLDKDRLLIPFNELKEKVADRLVELGFGNSQVINLEKGRYVVVGDSHGKHTKKNMFALLKVINKVLKPTKIIHVGHILDDDNDISYDWGEFGNLIIVAKSEELKVIQDQRNKFKFNYDVVRGCVNIGGLSVFNQDMIMDYVKSPISGLDTEIFEDKVIVNCHRQEISTKCANDGASYYASPGCLCERHVISTIKQIDFDDGKTVKQAFPEGFIKYRRMQHTNKYWEQGLLVVDVDKSNNHTIIPCAIKNTKYGFTTSYFDKIITSKGVFNPDKKIFVNGDMHCDLHDVNVLDIQEQICKDYQPDVQVNVGDTFNYSSLNHHVMDRGGVIMDKKILDEAAQTYYVLKRTSKWAKESHLICGNHERFARDFAEKYPQFGKYLDFKFICNLESLGYKLTDFKSVLKIGSSKFIHGEIRMYGQSGSKLEKASRTFGRDVFIGHVHSPAIRFGCYSIGLSGQLNQSYNEPDASNWLHGFGMCNQFKGQSWPTTISIVNNRCVLGGKTYKPVDPASWKMPSDYSVNIVYDF